MKKIYILSLAIFLVSFSLSAQDYKWSVEANYPISVGDDLGNDAPGIIDAGVKYRFLDYKIAKIGAGINAGYFKKTIDNQSIPQSTNFDETIWIIQPKVFAEFTIPSISKLHPSIGLGYSFVNIKDEGLFFDENIKSSGTEGGINLNMGLSYDITKRFFLQAQYDYVNTKKTFSYEQSEYVDRKYLGYLKAGIGFRF